MSELNNKKYLDFDGLKKYDELIKNLIASIQGGDLGEYVKKDTLKDYVTTTELANNDFATVSQVSTKEDIIEDLENIRSGAASGATAIQESKLNDVLSGYYTKSETDTTIKNGLKDYAKKSEIKTYTDGTNISIDSNNKISAQGYTYNIDKNSTSIGTNNTITQNNSYLIGEGLTSCDKNCLVIGEYNIEKFFGSDKTLFVIGQGSSTSLRDNVFLVQKGKAACKGEIVGGQGWVGDFAEYFEWTDGNPNNEDRVGYMVQLNESKIEKATNISKCIGVISSTYSFVSGGCFFEWKDKYLTDDFCRQLKDENGNPIINPEYNETLEYIPREQRKEWSPVGLVGQVLTRQDGTLEVGGFAGCKDGIATKSDNGYRVLKIVNENVALLLVK